MSKFEEVYGCSCGGGGGSKVSMWFGGGGGCPQVNKSEQVGGFGGSEPNTDTAENITISQTTYASSSRRNSSDLRKWSLH